MVATLLWLLVVGLLICSVLAVLTQHWSQARPELRPTGSDLFGTVPILAFATVGSLIVWRQPRNRIGWLLIASGFMAVLLSLPRLYAGLALDLGWHSLPGPLWAYWFSTFDWVFVLILFLVLVPLFYPDGRLPGRRWRILLWGCGLVVVLTVISALDPTGAPAGLPVPAGIQAFSGLNNFLTIPITIFAPVSGLAAAVSLAFRFRRGNHLEREQLKWLIAAAALTVVAITVSNVVPVLQNAFLVPLAASAVPIAIGMAILRYRLYDIDLIINKALVYGGLALIITAVYVLVVINIGALVGGSQRLWLSLVTTAVIALAFQPLRERAQRLANRLVYGQRATPHEALSAFSTQLSETYSQDDILARMSRILARGTGAERAEVWVRAGQRLVLASSSLPAAGTATEYAMANGTLPNLQRDALVPVTHRGELLGALAVVKQRGETMTAVEQKLVADLAGQAGLVLKNVGLNRELLARLDDLRASRQRLIVAQDEERRRIERDLHDGAQQHLVALKMKVGVAEALAGPDGPNRAILGQLKQDADAAIDRLRELARGVYPPLLASDGLEIALRSHLRHATVPTELEAEKVPRQPREVESAVYFCCLEALQNVAKSAQAKSARVRLWTEGSALHFSVTDDGKGFDLATAARSSGLQNMRDRIESLDGSFEIESSPGSGTSVSGSVPLTPG